MGNHDVCKKMTLQSNGDVWEFMLQTYNHLLKNIEINNFDKIIVPHNIGLGDVSTSGEVQKSFVKNPGAIQLKEAEEQGGSNIKIERLDDIDLKEERIDFVKIDVEFFEPKTLAGMRETVKKYRPAVFIEVFKKNRKFVLDYFEGLGYEEPVKGFKLSNFLFLPKEK